MEEKKASQGENRPERGKRPQKGRERVNRREGMHLTERESTSQREIPPPGEKQHHRERITLKYRFNVKATTLPTDNEFETTS